MCSINPTTHLKHQRRAATVFPPHTEHLERRWSSVTKCQPSLGYARTLGLVSALHSLFLRCSDCILLSAVSSHTIGLCVHGRQECCEMAGQWDSCRVRMGGWCVRKGVEAPRMKKRRWRSGAEGRRGGRDGGADLNTVQRLQGSTGCPGFGTVTVLERWLWASCANTNGWWRGGQQLPGGKEELNWSETGFHNVSWPSRTVRMCLFF